MDPPDTSFVRGRELLDPSPYSPIRLQMPSGLNRDPITDKNSSAPITVDPASNVAEPPVSLGMHLQEANYRSSGPFPTLVLGLCYRSPTSDAVNNGLLLEALDKTMGNKNAQRVMIMGDFNYPAIDFGECKVNAGEGSEDYKFYSRLQKLFLVQNVTEPTRVRGGQESSVLDYIITDEDNLVDDLNYEVPMGKSDHVCLTWRLGLEREELQQGPQEKFDYYRGNYEEISAALRAVDWDGRMGDGEDLEKMWACFREMVTEVVNKWVPKRKIKKKTGRVVR